MAVTESSLLTSFLLPPAPLSVSLTLQQFTELFPKSRQDDEAIPALYRELQKQRAQDIDRVKQNIAAEVKVGEMQQRHIKRIRQARLQQQSGDDGMELNMEAKVGHDLCPQTYFSNIICSSSPKMQTISSARRIQLTLSFP